MGFLGESALPASCLGVPIGAGARSPPEFLESQWPNPKREFLSFHGNKSQRARTLALANFKKGEFQALVATNIAVRGLDIDQLQHVVNFDLPNVPEDYVHRIGRAGREGEALSLVSPEEKQHLTGIERLLRSSLPRWKVE